MYIAEAAEGKGQGKGKVDDNPNDEEVIIWYIIWII